MQLLRTVLALGFMSLVLMGCATSTPSPQALPESVGAGQGSVAEYQLGAGDKVRVNVFGEDTLTGEYFVSGAGRIALPLIGEVPAAGSTVGQFSEEVARRLRDGYINEPRVSTEVLNYRPFYILGEVGNPGTYPYTSQLTVFNAVATAGGFSYRADQRRVFIRRAGEAEEHEVALTSTTTVAPGDTIRIAERFF